MSSADLLLFLRAQTGNVPPYTAKAEQNADMEHEAGCRHITSTIHVLSKLLSLLSPRQSCAPQRSSCKTDDSSTDNDPERLRVCAG